MEQRGRRLRADHVAPLSGQSKTPVIAAGVFFVYSPMVVAKYLLYDDYSEGAHPEILRAVVDANDGQQMGYGDDEYCASAARIIAAELNVDADVHFVSGGTQANIVCLASLLRPHEGVLAASSGHIHVHETGAIEATGHKILTVDAPGGKLTPELIDAGLALHADEHTVKPRAVFVSQATELGTVYTLGELTSLVRHAHSNGLIVYLDGARLAMACASTATTLADIAATGVDMLYVGGTKNGGLFGEAVAIINPELRADFRYTLKQRGALLAKGRPLGAQFARFFADDRLWYQLGAAANARARQLAGGLRDAGIELFAEPAVNQVFATLPDDVAARLAGEYGFHVWSRHGDSVVVRLVCSWATPSEAVTAFVAAVVASL